MANAHLSRMLLQAANCRRSNAVRPTTTIFSRQILSGGAARFHTTTKVRDASEGQNLSEGLSLTQPAAKKTRRRKKVHDESTVEADAKPRKPRRKKSQMLSDKYEASDVSEERAERLKLKPAPRWSARSPRAFEGVGGVELPPVESWQQFFPVWNGRRTKSLRAVVREVHTADVLAEAFVPEGSKDMTVIEVSAGPGQLTRSLLRLPKGRINKLVVLEDNPFFAPWQEALPAYDPRVRVYREDGYDWAGYTKVEESGLLDDIEVVDWQIVHPKLVVIMHLNGDVYGEQLMAQLLRSIPDRHWLFKFGRVPLHVVSPIRMWERMSSLPGKVTRCKVSVMTQAAAEITETLPFSHLQPYSDHFHPQRLTQTDQPKGRNLVPRGFGSPHAALTVTPKVDQFIQPGDLDYWDYCLRKLFVQKATPMNKIVGALGPGANNLIPKLTDSSLPPNEILDMSKTPRDLDLHEWQLVVRAFKAWPFRPESLSIDNFSTGVRGN